VPATDFERIFAALQVAGVRYLTVGGVAVVLHGHPRFTADLDLILSFEQANLLAALGALEALGYRPRAPVPATDFADPKMRRKWVQDKGVTVFSMWSSELPATEIDLFVEEPLPFEEAFARAIIATLDEGDVSITVASIPDLIFLKERAGRPQDLADIDALRKIAREGGDT